VTTGVFPYEDLQGTAAISAHVAVFSLSTAYDDVIDEDDPISHWKMGYTATLAPDRKGLLDLISGAYDNPMAEGLVQNNGDGLANSVASVFWNPSGGELYASTNWSMEVWIKRSDSYGYIIKHGNQGLFLYPNGIVDVEIETADDYFQADSATAILPGEVGHIVGTYDGAEMVLYLNGVESARVAVTDALTYDNPLAIGGFSGVCDEAAWYDHALPADRVLAHYLVATSPLPVSLGLSPLTVQLTDDAGNTVPGQVDVRLRDGSPADAFSDETGATPVALPVATGNDGNVTLWLVPGRYEWSATRGSDTLPWTAVDVSGVMA
jgi:hypothetical protein